MPVPHSGANLA